MDYAKTMRFILLCITMTMLTSVSAEVYRTLDEDGNVIFTDKPSPDAEKIKIDKIQTVSPPPVEDFEYTPPEKTTEFVYTTLEIVSPENDQVFTGNIGDVTVSIMVQPELNAAQGDRLLLSMDGNKQEDSSSTFKFTNLDRGVHTVKVDVVNKDGKSLKSSAPVSFTVIRTSVLNPNRSPPP
jgi:uncharacterized protein DUF4124